MKRILIIFILCFAYTMTLAQGAGGNRASDSLALVALYRSTDGPNWGSKWNLDEPINRWFGVTVSRNRVIEIDLDRNQLNGSIPSELGNLSELRSLELKFNLLSGSIPSELGKLSKLTSLDLYRNQLNGSIPSELGNLSQLTYLSLSSNQLSGSIPSELGQLTRLTRLYLDFNQLSGSIPSELGNLSQLTRLALSSNQLNGSIPSELGQLTRLTDLFLSSNQLNGSIPIELGQLTRLRHLALSSNQLNGSIPIELGNLSQLIRLFLSSNQLNGSIPIELGKLSKLRFLFASSNQLNGPIPIELGQMTRLTRLDLSNNFFTELPNLKVLNRHDRIFEVQTNYLDFGDLLPNIRRLTRYAPQRPVREGMRYDLASGDELFLSVNVGGTGNRYQWYKDNRAIRSSTNATFRIANVVPSDAGLYRCEITNPRVAGLTLGSIADTLSVSYNRISDSLALVALYNSTNGPGWLSMWNLMQPINTWHGVNLNDEDRVDTLQLFFNNLNGSIPSELGNMSELKELDLADNQLSGSIPSELGLLSRLTSLSLHTNQLSGSIPSELGQHTQFTGLFLHSNQLSGSIPSELGNMSELKELDLADNQLSGPIPSELGMLTQLTLLDLNSNQLSGSIPSELGMLTQLTLLDLNSNQLSGSIPSELGMLIRLRQLDLNSNQLSGPIPSELGMLSKLTLLDLNSNQLSGSIPSELGLLSRLTRLELSNNFFTELPNLDHLTFLGIDTSSGKFEVQNNYLDFGDLLPNIGKLTRYAPQRPVREGMRYDLNGGDELLLSVNVGGTDNQYQWYKDNVAIMSSNNDTFRIDSTALSDGGLYRCEITNPGATDLTLESIADTVRVRVFDRNSDSLALVALYRSTDGPNWTNNWNLADSSINTWYGVSLNDDEDRVATLRLSSNNLNGSIPSELGNLRELTTLTLNFNQLSGPIPSELGKLSRLITLILSNNFFTELPNLDHLSDLGLAAFGFPFEVQTNYLDFGDLLPNINRLTIYAPQRPVREGMRYDLASGDELLLSVNVGGTGNQYQWYKDNRAIMSSTNATFRIANVIPSDAGLYRCEITNSGVPNLALVSIADTLSVSYNRISDSLALVALYNSTDGPNWGSKWDLMQPINRWHGVRLNGDEDRVATLQLGFNNLNGSIPSELGNLSQLSQLSLYSNQLNGSIPSELGNLSELTFLRLDNNQLSGSIPSELGNLIQLTSLSLGSNQLSGSVPSELGMLIQLTILSLGRNQLNGSIPSELGKLSKLRTLYLYSNQLSGSIPSELDNLTRLTLLGLDNNFFTELPDLDILNRRGEIFEVQTNYLDFGDLLPNINRLTIYAPQRPVREGVRYDLTSGDELLLSVNVGGADNQYQWYKDNVAIMSSNNDTFRIANVALSDSGLYHCEITNPGVARLTLKSIADTVSVEFSDRNLDSLALVALYRSTDGPNWRSKWTLEEPINTWRGITVAKDRVTKIDLNSNILAGTIPRELGSLDQLQYLDLADNQLEGSIPPELGDLSKLRRLILRNNQLSGSIPSELGDLTQLERLILRDNKLSGSIPKELGKLTNLVLLNLARNSLTGTIPPQLSNFPRMRNFVLSSNKLSGAIPEELRNLTTLSQLRLYDNFFTSLPDLSHINFPDAFEVYLNHLDFEDMLPNLSRFRLFTFNTLPRYQSYNPQRPLREGQKYELSEGDDLVLTINKVKGENNRYQWYRNDIPISNARDTSISLTNVNIPDAGLYYCRVTHPRFSITFLRSSEDTVVVDGVTNLSKLTDSLALVALYNSTDGDNWTNSWDLTQPINTWRGITVANDRVTRINLNSNILVGTIPRELGSVNQLQYLNLVNNQLSGSIPPELGDLAQLQRLILRDNLLNDTIPKELGKLTNLVLLNLARNSLTGTIPPQLSNFPRMRNFVLSSNKLSGAIPEELRNLTTLSQLRLYDNFFTSLPDLSHINFPDAFEVYLNHLDFEDMLPNLSRFRLFTFDTLPRYQSYNPQRHLREGEKYELSEGDDLVLRINKVKGENNRYQWYKNDIPISNARDTSISLTSVNTLDAGLYYCRVTHPRFSITFLRSSEDTIIILDSDLGGRLSARSTSYSSEEEEMSVQVYPNPVVDGTIFIRVEHRAIDDSKPITAIFYNLVGIEVYREENILLSGVVPYEWFLGDLSRGIYILRLFIDDRVIERRIMMK